MLAFFFVGEKERAILKAWAINETKNEKHAGQKLKENHNWRYIKTESLHVCILVVYIAAYIKIHTFDWNIQMVLLLCKSIEIPSMPEEKKTILQQL